MKRSKALSDFDVMFEERLPNWGRWGRQDGGRPDPHRGSSGIYAMGRTLDRDEEAAPESNDPVDAQDAEFIDDLLKPWAGSALMARHREIIRTFYYRRRIAPLRLVREAVRHLLDAESVATCRAR